jgi:hypothetical protein
MPKGILGTAEEWWDRLRRKAPPQLASDAMPRPAE